MISPRLTLEDAERAFEAWGLNCGPAAICAILNKTPDEVRPHMGAVEGKGYTSPTMMYAALDSLGVTYAKEVLRTKPAQWEADWPFYGLARIQWEGPWTKPGVPARVAYMHTHWVAAYVSRGGAHAIFDVNCLNNGSGWVAAEDWQITVATFLTSGIKRADGRWHVTHKIEVQR